MSFKDVYQTPIKITNGGIYGVCSNGTKAFTAFGKEPMMQLAKVVGLLNGERDDRYKKEDVVVQGTKICVMGYVLLVRGWGKLIGSGELCLPINDAAKIQDDFISWVVDTITE